MLSVLTIHYGCSYSRPTVRHIAKMFEQAKSTIGYLSNRWASCYNVGYYYYYIITVDRGYVLIGGKYDQRPDGLHISNMTSSDEGVYCCQAVVESSGMFKEQTVTLKLLGTNFVKLASHMPAPNITWYNSAMIKNF